MWFPCVKSRQGYKVPLSCIFTDHIIIIFIFLFFKITEDPKKRMSVLNHHFVRHPGKIFEENPEAFTELTGVQQFPPEQDPVILLG